jgi:group I intron endonuclease
MKYFTYKITNTINGKRYCGWTNKPIEKRFDVHVHNASKGSKLLLHNAIRKYGVENFTTEIVNVFLSKCEALDDEKLLIAEQQTNHCRHPNKGYNMTDGGEGTAGLPRNKNQSDASKRNIVAYNLSTKGQTYEEIYGDRAEEQKRMRADKTRGQKRSLIVRKAISKRLKGNKHGNDSVRVIYNDGTTVTFASKTEARIALGIKTHTTLLSIMTGKRWRNGKWEKYNSPYPFQIIDLKKNLAFV